MVVSDKKSKAMRNYNQNVLVKKVLVTW